MRFTLAVLILVVSLPATFAQEAQACCASDIRGYYAVSCSGWTLPAPTATQQVPFALLGTVTLDQSGAASGPAKVSVGGAILNLVATGTAIVNADCTGIVSYDQKVEGQPGPKLNLVFHVLNNGRELRGMAVDAGSTITCSLRLIRR